MPEMWMHDFDPDSARCTACGVPFSEAVKSKRLCAVKIQNETPSVGPLTETDRIWQSVVDIARPGAVPKRDIDEDRDFEPLEEELQFCGVSPEL